MLFCPLLFYGGCREGRDMDFGQFSVMFRSIFMEGLARPLAGVRLILKTLVRKFKELGGEIRLRSGVSRFSSATGRWKKWCWTTVRNCPPGRCSPRPVGRKRSAFDQSVGRRTPRGRSRLSKRSRLVDAPPRTMGVDRTITFFNDSADFCYARPDDLVDVRSGVICVPNNFAYTEPMADNLIRITALANFDRWAALDPDAYRLAKLRWYDKMVASAVRIVPDFRSAVIDTDMFTPTTIRRFTGHVNGAVYGAPEIVRRHHAPEESLHLRNGPGFRGNRRLGPQRNYGRQRASVEIILTLTSPPCHATSLRVPAISTMLS